MDTRTKIVLLPQAQSELREGKWLIIAGFFDPMTAAVAQRIDNLVSKEVGARVLVAVLEDFGPLLTSSERCSLMAALRMVDSVVAISQDQLDALFSGGERVRCVVDFEADRNNSYEFTQLIVNKERLNSRPDGVAS